MTPKEKAKELVDKFLYANKGHFYQDSPLEDLEAAKECALVAVDEIIDAIFWHEFEVPNKEVKFWFEVKKEIEKIQL